ncbi:MAG: DKNYY domain-containing protein [Planctomycetaceae bacterium]
MLGVPDVETFQVLNSLYAKDARNAYTIKGPIREADVSTFRAIGTTEHAFNTTNGYAKDAKFAYHTIVGGKACVIKDANATSFSARGKGYGSDNAAVYFERKKMSGALHEKWRHIRGPHSNSEKNAYVLAQRIRGANGNCLESLPILETGVYWCRDDSGYYRWDKPCDPEEYFKEFRHCFIFLGKVSKVSLTWNHTEPLDPTNADSWNIAQHAWFFVDCKEWIQKPELDVADAPRIGESFKFGEGLHLGLLPSLNWMEEDRIWVFKPVQDHQRVEKRLLLSSTMVWWEYSSLDQLGCIEKTIAAAGSA